MSWEAAQGAPPHGLHTMRPRAAAQTTRQLHRHLIQLSVCLQDASYPRLHRAFRFMAVPWVCLPAARADDPSCRPAGLSPLLCAPQDPLLRTAVLAVQDEAAAAELAGAVQAALAQLAQAVEVRRPAPACPVCRAACCL